MNDTELPTNPAEAEPPPTEEVEQEAPPETGAEDEPEGEGQTPEEEFEEVDLGGKKVRVAKDAVPHLMMHADYTRKTQEVAASRKELEARAQAIEAEREKVAQRAKADEALFQSRAELHGLGKELSKYTAEAWRFLQEKDEREGTNEFQKHLARHTSLKAEHDKINAEISEKERQRELEAQQEIAKRNEESAKAYYRRIEEAHAVLSKEIGWSEPLAVKVNDFGKSMGLTDEELGIMAADARFVKLAHYARIGFEAEKKAKSAAPKPSPQPIRGAGSSRAPATTGLRDDLTADEWIKRRNAEIKRQKTAH